MFNFDSHRGASNPIISESPSLFVLGLRRSGTSIIRKCINTSPNVELEFEPRDAWWTITQGHLPRFRNHKMVVHLEDAMKSTLSLMESCNLIGGAKFAFEPGIVGMYWRHIELRFKDPKFVFVRRNAKDTYSSYTKMDNGSVHGTACQTSFDLARQQIYSSFEDFSRQYPERSAFVDYEKLIAGKQIPDSVWNMIGVQPVDVSSMIRMPRNKEGM